MNIRSARGDDVVQIQHCNWLSLSQNFPLGFFYYYVLRWPPLCYVAEDTKGNIVGYILSKMEKPESEKEKPKGCIISLGVKRPYRSMDIDRNLVKLSVMAMKDYFNAEYFSLNIRASDLFPCVIVDEEYVKKCTQLESID